MLSRLTLDTLLNVQLSGPLRLELDQVLSGTELRI
jgi:hypothetical protein